MRLKLLLSLLWLVRDDPAPVLAYPARAWAALLGLSDPAGGGARRINEALAWLETNGFLVTQKDPGRVQRLVTLLNETGTGELYMVPGAVIRQLQPGDERRNDHFYVQLPAGLWTNGWLSLLSGAAVAMLLIVFRLQANNPDDTQLWLSPADAKLRFDLSDDTRSKGLRELVRAGLITMERQRVDPLSFDYERVRNVYQLQKNRFSKPARILNDFALVPFLGVIADD